MSDYPWYAVVSGDSIEQGDILRHCAVFLPPSGLLIGKALPEDVTAEFEWVERDVIVLSQTCDLVKGREKVTEILLCAVWSCAEVGGHLATPNGMEDARRGNLPAYHMLAPCKVAGFESEVSVVDFRRVPCPRLRRHVRERDGKRLRLRSGT